MVRVLRYYTLVPSFFADPLTHSVTIWWGLPRTRRRRFLTVRRVQQKVLASAGGFWLGHVLLSLFDVLPLLWCSCHHSSCPSNLGTSTCHWCPAFWDIHHLSSDLVPACFPFAFNACQSRARKFTLISMPHHAVKSCTESSKVCIPSGVSAKIKMSSMKPMLLNW